MMGVSNVEQDYSREAGYQLKGEMEVERHIHQLAGSSEIHIALWRMLMFVETFF